jgi:hypothetical protein
MSHRQLLDAFRSYLETRDEPQVGDWFAGFDWHREEHPLPAATTSAIRHLAGVLDHCGARERRLAEEFVRSGQRLHWIRSYTASDFGQYFHDNYAHVELIGPRGHFHSDAIAAGLVLYGPLIHYPNHWHAAEEIYIPLTGNGYWSSDDGPLALRAAGALIFHTTNMRHEIKCGETPVLALWAWRGGDLAQKGNY